MSHLMKIESNVVRIAAVSLEFNPVNVNNLKVTNDEYYVQIIGYLNKSDNPNFSTVDKLLLDKIHRRLNRSSMT